MSADPEEKIQTRVQGRNESLQDFGPFKHLSNVGTLESLKRILKGLTLLLAVSSLVGLPTLR